MPKGKSEYRIEIKRREDLTPAQKTLIQEWIEDIFGDTELKHEWSEPDWHFFVLDGNETVSYLAVTERSATVDDRAVKLAGVGSVMTPKKLRDHGLASIAMHRVHAFICEELKADFGFLLCSYDLVPFYRKLGWELMDAPVMFGQTTGLEYWNEEAMVFPCAGQEWPEGEVDLCGPPW
ncbi:MAG TPA: GNAT family N-acetyltransferase [Candidatus Hydrogenedentes bacterium]|nr:GNAT family N-acetyltransferase [Candidatus Hydrogenedentota bacterium]HPG65273.1 GNAT family N-acetyltransferase [Candidatus Hydrogenedentota bacterium]